MKKLLIVNVGAAPDKQVEKYGDFEVMAQTAIGKTELETAFHDGVNFPLPDYETLAGVIIMGSLSMATERTEWMERLSQEILYLNKREIPLLGICFGHQLIAQTMGGKVDFHPQGLEIGSVRLDKTPEAAEDRLFSALPNSFMAHAVHFQSVISLPENATLLAHNEFEPHHAFRIGKNTWGVQFHPEFTADIMRDSLEGLKSEVKQGYADRRASITETEEARQVLVEFARLVESS